MSYGQWAAAWWQWAFLTPKATSPLFDQTGEYAALGQAGPVWFLAGTMGGDAERTVTVPSGQALFLPIVNNCWVNVPELGDNPWSPEQEAYARGVIAANTDAAVDLACEIDGRAVQDIQNYRCQTPEGMAFMVEVPEDDIWGMVSMGLTPGTHGPSVDDGYYLMLAPLSKGKHTIHFTGGVGDWFHLDVTYHLTVK
jgi:hypothetical protein